MLVEIPDPEVILGIIAAFLGGLSHFYDKFRILLTYFILIFAIITQAWL